jgi:hypothetical protein
MDCPIFLPTINGPQLRARFASASYSSASIAKDLSAQNVAGAHIYSIHLSHMLRSALETVDLEGVKALLERLLWLQGFEVTYDAIPIPLDPWPLMRMETWLRTRFPATPLVIVRQEKTTLFAHVWTALRAATELLRMK